MNSAALRDQQATDCLEAAERYRAPLLALATCLSGSKEEGMELYQQASLSCHDAIQANGFQGDGYTFYLRRAIKNLHYNTVREQMRRVPLPTAERTPADEIPEGYEPHSLQIMAHPRQELTTAQPEPEYSALAETVMAEAKARFPFADRIALNLWLNGMSCREIAEHIGTKDQSWVWRRLARMKAELRRIFQPAYDALGE